MATLAADIRNRSRGTMGLVMDYSNPTAYSSPRPAPRIGPDPRSEEAMLKNRGSMEFILQQDKDGKNKGYLSNRPEPRLKSAEAGDVYRRNQGVMNKVMNQGEDSYRISAHNRTRPEGEGIAEKNNRGTVFYVMDTNANKGYNSPLPAPRVKGEAEGYAVKNRGLMSKVLDSDANKNYESARPEPRVRSEASATAFAGRGGAMANVMDNDKNRNYSSSRPEPRVKPEAGDNAVKGRGRMDVVLGSKEAPPSGGRPEPRVKPEAEEIARMNKGTLSNIYANYGHLPISSRPDARVKGEGQEIAQHGNKGSVVHLFQKYGNLPNSGRPNPRVKPEAKGIAYKNKGSMSQIMERKY